MSTSKKGIKTKSKSGPDLDNDRSSSFVNNNDCPEKEGDNCKVPGVHSDSAPIGGG